MAIGFQSTAFQNSAFQSTATIPQGNVVLSSVAPTVIASQFDFHFWEGDTISLKGNIDQKISLEGG